MLSAQAYAPYADPEQYIVEWTDKIWQSYGMGLIRDHYHPDIALHGAYGHSGDRESIIEGCFVKKTAFPGRAFTAEDVVWEERTENSWVSSHRIINSGVQTGFWQYGPPSNRLSTSREHRALPRPRRLRSSRSGSSATSGPSSSRTASTSPASPVTSPTRPNATILGTLSEDGIFGPPPADPLTEGDSGPRPDNQPDECRLVLELIDVGLEPAPPQRRSDASCTAATSCYTSRYRSYCRAEGYQQSLGELIATFPDAHFDVRDVAANTDPFHGTRVSVMWNMRGTYAGAPTYGPLTYSPVDVLGISPLRVPGRQDLQRVPRLRRAGGARPRSSPRGRRTRDERGGERVHAEARRRGTASRGGRHRHRRRRADGLRDSVAPGPARASTPWSSSSTNPPRTRGSSHGSARITRRAYPEDDYVRLTG